MELYLREQLRFTKPETILMIFSYYEKFQWKQKSLAKLYQGFILWNISKFSKFSKLKSSLSEDLFLCQVPEAGILHIEWGSGIAQLEFYHCREPAWGTPPMTKVMRKEARHTQRRDRASGVPLEILEHLPPKPESAYFLFCAFTYTSDFTGGCLPLPLSEKRVSLQLQLIIPGCDSVSTYKLLWKSSSLPE